MPPNRKTVEKARKFRRALTPPEVILWQWMRGRPQGLKFRRQHPLGFYVLDFYYAAARIAIEVDGAVHDDPRQMAHDAQRDAWIAAQGVRIIRIRAADVLADLDAVARHILDRCAFPLHQPSAGPPPHAAHGEEL
ncbi:endonuclease domain-containing protein [Sphingobium terrigena]|uniref:Endonuclease domain-containing protein n=1 Tax=Sphingobium terrigena TaxID=2304063 RepID=A0A418YRV5_9SPHN|nr:endonuclease domain-containing protein [Sphingobium terrigena]RJG54396.1 endonuclease domain-containing protein [Sphingobium terrigena]